MVTASQINLKGLAPAYTTACSVTLLLAAKNSQLLKGGLHGSQQWRRKH